jgi:hypothetical protein
VCFVVTEEGSMSALAAASQRRDEHELEAHDYRHQRLVEHTRVQSGAMLAPKRPTSS